MSDQETIETIQPTWQEIGKAIKEVVVAGLYYKNPKTVNFLKIIKNYIQAKALFPNKDKYFQMKEQYKNWYTVNMNQEF